ncbi:hypothetical protein P9597_23255 [Aneurinibacillus migulanus]|uniref:hypothetical protein n=1 Tax=Aneurinibacillus migulanus TaxID=47500 RepID=UPI002E23BF56|nr:hypothetical protein [Aneurinibacillus migulanus]
MGVYSAIDNRAAKTLSAVAQEFEAGIPIRTCAEGKVMFGGEKLGVQHLTASYKVISKWMGRVYVYTWQFFLVDVSFPSNALITLKYSGKIGGRKSARFVSKSADVKHIIEKLNQDKKIKEICERIDFETIHIKYIEEKQSWCVEMRPNYGDFIWILLPPVFYSRRPNKKEVESTIQLIGQLSKYLGNASV